MERNGTFMKSIFSVLAEMVDSRMISLIEPEAVDTGKICITGTWNSGCGTGTSIGNWGLY